MFVDEGPQETDTGRCRTASRRSWESLLVSWRVWLWLPATASVKRDRRAASPGSFRRSAFGCSHHVHQMTLLQCLLTNRFNLALPAGKRPVVDKPYCRGNKQKTWFVVVFPAPSPAQMVWNHLFPISALECSVPEVTWPVWQWHQWRLSPEFNTALMPQKGKWATTSPAARPFGSLHICNNLKCAFYRCLQISFCSGCSLLVLDSLLHWH